MINFCLFFSRSQRIFWYFTLDKSTSIINSLKLIVLPWITWHSLWLLQLVSSSYGNNYLLINPFLIQRIVAAFSISLIKCNPFLTTLYIFIKSCFCLKLHDFKHNWSSKYKSCNYSRVTLFLNLLLLLLSSCWFSLSVISLLSFFFKLCKFCLIFLFNFVLLSLFKLFKLLSFAFIIFNFSLSSSIKALCFFKSWSIDLCSFLHEDLYLYFLFLSLSLIMAL